MIADLIAKYAWTEPTYAVGEVDELEAWTVAVIEGREPAEVIRLYGGNPDRPVGDHTFAEMLDLQDPRADGSLTFHVQVFTCDGYVVALENNGWTGAVKEIAARCAPPTGRFFSVYWSVNAVHQILEVIDGTLTAHFELRDGDHPFNVGDLAPAWLTDGLVVDLAALRSTAMALMEQQTGLSVEQSWLSQRRPTYRIPDPYSLIWSQPVRRTIPSTTPSSPDGPESDSVTGDDLPESGPLTADDFPAPDPIEAEQTLSFLEADSARLLVMHRAAMRLAAGLSAAECQLLLETLERHVPMEDLVLFIASVADEVLMDLLAAERDSLAETLTAILDGRPLPEGEMPLGEVADIVQVRLDQLAAAREGIG